MTVYPDPSLIVAAFVDEPNTALAKGFLIGLPSGGVLTSWWTYTEITSALGVKSRTGSLDAELRPNVLFEIRAALRKATVTIALVAGDFETASSFMENSDVPLRGGDALHLAVARRHDATVWTLDRRMAEAGQALGLGTRLLA